MPGALTDVTGLRVGNRAAPDDRLVAQVDDNDRDEGRNRIDPVQGKSIAVDERRRKALQDDKEGGPIERPAWRPVTRYEARGLGAGRTVTDLWYARRTVDQSAR